MNTYDNIKQSRIKAFKEKDSLKKELLSFIMGGMDSKGIDKLEGDEKEKAVQDHLVEVRTGLKKFVKDITEHKVKITEEIQEGLDKNKAEQEIIQAFMPKNLTNEELESVIDTYIIEVGKNLGAVMKKLKTEHPNRYDGLHAKQYTESKISE